MKPRRKFIKQLGAATLATGISKIAQSTNSMPSKEAEKIQVGLVGCRGMGWADLSSMLKKLMKSIRKQVKDLCYLQITESYWRCQRFKRS